MNLHNVRGTGHALRVRAPSLWLSSQETLDDADADQADAHDSGDEQNGSTNDHFAAGNSPINAGLQDGANIRQDSGHCSGSSFREKTFFLKFVLYQ